MTNKKPWVMTKKQLSEEVYERAGLNLTKKAVKIIVDNVFSTIIQEVVEGREVRIVNFGQWNSKMFKAHTGRDPQTGEKIKIGTQRIIKFKPGRGFKKEVKNT